MAASNSAPDRQPIDRANVVINFHAGDQHSADALLSNLLAAEEGISCRYYLQYGDDWSTLRIGETVEAFCRQREVVRSNELPEIDIPSAFVADDPNDEAYSGLHTRRSPQFKRRFFNWNLCVYKYIAQLDHFQVVEPDCVVLRHGWLASLTRSFERRRHPIFGHLKEGMIGGRLWPTHWAGCSYYDGRELRALGLERYFSERFANPWWSLREQPGTQAANNAFFGPCFSAYDATYDYLLFAVYARELTGSDDPRRWLDAIERDDEPVHVHCDFRSALSANELIDRELGRLALFHGMKDDRARYRAAELLRIGQSPMNRAGAALRRGLRRLVRRR